MLVSEIATRVKRQFGDEAGAQITDADIIRWVNDGMRDIAANNDLLQVRSSLATVVGQAEYALPTGILVLRSVKVDGVNLKSLSMQEADEFVENNTSASASSGNPSSYWMYANLITLYPTPDTIGTLTLYYTKQPVEVVAVGDTPELSVQYHNRLVEYCLAQAYELDDDTEAHVRKMTQFEQGLDKLKVGAEGQPAEFYPHVTMTEEDGYWYGN